MTEKELQLATQLLEVGTLSLRHVQLGMEWSARTGERLAKILSDMASVSGDSLGTAADQLRSDTEGQRRRFQRHPAQDDLRIQLGNETMAVQLIDVSLGGVAFTVDRKLDIGSQVLVFTNDEPIPARVRHCAVGSEGGFVGVEFEPRDVDDLTRIETWIGSLSRL